MLGPSPRRRTEFSAKSAVDTLISGTITTILHFGYFMIRRIPKDDRPRFMRLFMKALDKSVATMEREALALTDELIEERRALANEVQRRVHKGEWRSAASLLQSRAHTYDTQQIWTALAYPYSLDLITRTRATMNVNIHSHLHKRPSKCRFLGSFGSSRFCWIILLSFGTLISEPFIAPLELRESTGSSAAGSPAAETVPSSFCKAGSLFAFIVNYF